MLCVSSFKTAEDASEALHQGERTMTDKHATRVWIWGGEAALSAFAFSTVNVEFRGLGVRGFLF